MAGTLTARLEKLEVQFLPPETVRHRWRIVCSKGDEKAATELAKSRGFDPDNADHFMIMHLIVSPAGSSPRQTPPYVLS